MVHRSALLLTLLTAALIAVEPKGRLFGSTGIVGGPQQKGATKAAAPKQSAQQAGKLAEMPAWLNDYAVAMDKARSEQKMLLVHFCKGGDANCAAIERTLSQPQLRNKVQRYVLARVSPDASISSEGRQTKLLHHASFNELRGGPGLAVIDLAHKQQPYYGRVVSAVPTTGGRFYQFRPDHVPAVLDLPPGTLTQRTMIFAVRTHPERPASTAAQQTRCWPTRQRSTRSIKRAFEIRVIMVGAAAFSGYSAVCPDAEAMALRLRWSPRAGRARILPTRVSIACRAGDSRRATGET